MVYWIPMDGRKGRSSYYRCNIFQCQLSFDLVMVPAEQLGQPQPWSLRTFSRAGDPYTICGPDIDGSGSIDDVLHRASQAVIDIVQRELDKLQRNEPGRVPEQVSSVWERL